MAKAKQSIAKRGVAKLISPKVLKLSMVTVALLLIPRRSSRQADIRTDNNPYSKNKNTEKNKKQQAKEYKISDDSEK